MGVNVKVDYDNLPNGAEVEIPYLGLFENGSSREVDEGDWQRFLDLQPGARERYEDESSVEFSTAQAESRTEAYSELNEAVDSGSLSDKNKDELVKLASEAGLETEGLKKAELVAALEKSVGGQTIPDESQEG